MFRSPNIGTRLGGLGSAWLLSTSLITLQPAISSAQCPGVWSNDTDAGITVPPAGLLASAPAAPSIASEFGADFIPSGFGGLYTAYEAPDPIVGVQVYVSRLDEEGNVVWTVTPDPSMAPDAACSPGTSPPLVCSDGSGGCIVAWGNSPVCGVGQIFVARITSIGIVAWVVTPGDPTWGPIASGTFTNLRLVSDGAGGAWLSFFGGAPTCGAGGSAIYVNHVSSAGALAFGPGALLGTCVVGYVEPSLDSFMDPVNGPTVVVAASVGVFPPGSINAFAANLSGIAWTVAPINTPGLTGVNPSVACDAAGLTTIVWDVPAVGAGDIYMQQITATGLPLRFGAAQVLCDAPTTQGLPRAVPDDLGGVYVVWQDARNNGLYMQHVDENSPGALGMSLWTDDGIPLTEVAYAESECTLLADGKNGFIAAWRTTRGVSDDIYAQRVSPTGQLLWTTSTGVPVLTGAGVQSMPSMTVINFLDSTSGEPNWAYAVACADAQPAAGGVRGVLVQRLDYFGAVGCAAPVAMSLGDVAGDDGGFVELNFTRSYRDELTRNDIEYYSIWRKIQLPAFKSNDLSRETVDLSRASRAQLEAAAKSAEGALVRVSPAGMPSGMWELVGTQPAHHAAVGYSYTAATRMDISDVTPEPEALHDFFVSAHSFRPNVWWDSNVVSGFSVDNLAPPPPSSFAVQQQYLTPKAGGQPIMVLSWVGSTAADLREYLIFRGNTPDFVPGSPATALGHAAGERFQDTTVIPGEVVFYRVAAIDRHGNLSPYTNAAGGIVQTGTDPAQSSVAFSLGQNQPNPASGRTVIAWSLAHSAPTSLRVFDVRGRLVRTLVSEVRERGAHLIAWDGTDDHGAPAAAGSYVYRLEAGSFQQSRRLLLVR